jgi:CspA family cold shock protein
MLQKTGKIKFFDTQKGYGFIVPDDGTKDVHLRSEKLPKGVRTLTPGQRCQFVPDTGPKGVFAREFSVL